MRRIATVLAAAAILAVGLSATQANARDGGFPSAWHNGGGHESSWRAQEWRGPRWGQQQWRAHPWYPRHHGYFGR